ncbi:RNA polymerase sigma factor [Henriciella barbarensis]|nr:sigma factor-like helix-turn-helix DNA-binding protein [Henriciella barbarensis]
MRALGEGHGEAMRQVFALTSPKIYGKVVALLKTPELAQRALSATYLKLWKNHASIPPTGCDYMHFIAAMAHQAAIDIRFSDTSNGELLPHVPNPPSDAAGLMGSSALNELSEADRDMLTAAYLKFENIEQIASRTGVSASDVRARLTQIVSIRSGGAQ